MVFKVPLGRKISGSLPSPQLWLCWLWSTSRWAVTEWRCLVATVQAWWVGWELTGGQQWRRKGSQPRKSCWSQRKGKSHSEGLGSVHCILQPLQGRWMAWLPPQGPQSSLNPAGSPRRHHRLSPTAALRESWMWEEMLCTGDENGLGSWSLSTRSRKVAALMMILLPSSGGLIGFPDWTTAKWRLGSKRRGCLFLGG